MSEIFENNSTESGATTPPFPNELDTQNPKSHNLLLIKYRLFKESQTVYYKYYIAFLTLQLVNIVADALINLLSNIPSVIASAYHVLIGILVFVSAILFLVYYFSYISKMKLIAKFSGNKKLSSAATMQFISAIGSFITGALSMISIFALIIYILALSYGSLGDIMYDMLWQPRFYIKLAVGLAIFICLVLVFSILSIVGQFKEYSGYIVEVSSIDSELVSSFTLAKTWFTVSFILNIVIGVATGIAVAIWKWDISKFDLKYLLISAIIEAILFVALFYKYNALKQTVLILEAKTKEQ